MKYRCQHCGQVFSSTTVLHECNGAMRVLNGHIQYVCDHEVNFCNGDCLRKAGGKMKNYIITSDRWAREPVKCTITDIQEQAIIYERDRLPEDQPVTVTESVVNGKNIITDNTGDVIAIEACDYSEEE